MKIIETPLPGVFEFQANPHEDARGLFTRLYCPDTFRDAGIDFTSTQINLSTNTRKHTLRGLHFQDPPFAEAKLVRCVKGSVWDVAVDMRPGATLGMWHAVTLDAKAMNAVLLPEGVAHGFLTLTDDADVLYQMGRSYTPGHGKGIRWDDPDLNISWPNMHNVMSEQDANLPSWRAVLEQSGLERPEHE